MLQNRIVEYVFFFGFMGIVGYLVWEMIHPFISTLALSAIIVTICYPIYTRVLKRTPRKNESLAAFVTTLVVLCMVILPLFLITSALIHETLSIYKVLNTDEIGIEKVVRTFELQIQAIVPSFDLDISEYAKQSAAWLAGSLAAFFAGTASTIFHLFIAILGAFYLFKDGKKFTKSLIRISPLPDNQDEIIMNRMATAVRSVATGTVLVALIQGTLTAFGFWLFGFDRAILWGVVAAFGALIPGIGTTIVFGPAIAYLAYIGALPKAIGLAVWGMLAVGLIDNLLGPYLMSRGHNMHPFLILLSVLGGVMIFGPIGFIVGPVIISLFAVLLEIYLTHISDHSPK